MAQHMTKAPKWDELQFGSLLGEGAFARVHCTKNTKTGQVFALKVVEKRQVQALDRMKSVINERNIHSSLDHEGIVRLYCAWHDETAFYFALELVEGGELAAQIFRMGTCSRDFCQFYTAEIIVILEYLRSQRIAYRDLKPQNLMLTLRGHLKLSDFDAAVVVPDEGDGDAAGGCGKRQQMTFAGTSWYLCPEVIAGTAQFRTAYALDLWALGCIVYEMLTGGTPFQSSPASPEYVLFQRILKCEYSFSKDFPCRKAQSLIEALLCPDPGARLGMAGEGLEELKRHVFFGGSTASFVDLLQCQPPQRVDRLARGLQSELELGCSEDSSPSLDFGSSAECTPEVGQSFLARHSQKIPVSKSQVAKGSDGFAGEFILNIQADSRLTSPRDGRLASPRDGRLASPRPVEPPSRSRSEECRSEPPLQPSSPTRLAPAHVQQLTPRFDDISVPSTPSSACRWLRPDRPFLSWPQWLHELVVRKTLMEDEGVIVCGSVVRRKIPCLRPKVLMLTDKQRLLLLDSSGLRLVREIPLEGSGEVSVVAKSSGDFELHTSLKTYYCYDVNGMEEWKVKIDSACEKLCRPS